MKRVQWRNEGMLRSAGVIISLAVLSGCSSPPETSSVLQVIRVYPAKLETAAHDEGIAHACSSWSLDAKQVESFFKLSKEYQEDPYRMFYQVPCSISGELKAGGEAWKFNINGGATATWSREGEIRHWGCSVEECERLVMIATDSMDPG